MLNNLDFKIFNNQFSNKILLSDLLKSQPVRKSFGTQNDLVYETIQSPVTLLYQFLQNIKDTPEDSDWALFVRKKISEEVFSKLGRIDIYSFTKENPGYFDQYREGIEYDLNSTLWKNIFTDIIQHPLIFSLFSHLGDFDSKKLNLIDLKAIRRCSGDNHWLENVPTKPSSYYFLYCVKTHNYVDNSEGDEVWFPDINEFFTIKSNDMLIMEAHELNSYLIITNDIKYNYYITGLLEPSKL